MRLRTYFAEDVRAEIGDYDAREELRLRLPAGFKHFDSLSQAQFLEITSHLSGSVLPQHDRMSMAHGASARSPFLDHRVAAFAARLPARCKLRGLSEQETLKRIASRFVAAADMRPQRASERTSDRASAAAGFFGTLDAPHSHDFADELLSRERIADAGIFDPVAVERLVRKARRGEAIAAKDDMALVAILSTQLIVDRFIRASRREMACGFLQPPPHSASNLV
jgi:asparagine synthase (glutamine-hydrolysing)